MVVSLSLVGRSPQFLNLLDVARRVAKSHASILILGESGTGKENFARFIHQESHFREGPFIAINCAAIPSELLESEMFGHAKGSFTGATEKKMGLFEAAQDGTLFLDEIGDLSFSLQAKLLRVLQDKEVRRVGETQVRPINCRLISATHKNLEKEIEAGNFREDLFYRLNVIELDIPPLRDRKEDILPLVELFLNRACGENSCGLKKFSSEATMFILGQPWKGNVRELENFVERAVVLSRGSEIQLSDLKNALPAHHWNGNSPIEAHLANSFVVEYNERLPTVDTILHRYIEFAVAQNGGAQDRTAKEIGIDRKTLYKRLKHAP